MIRPVVVTAIWGDGHLPYLCALLESLRRLGYEPSDIVVAHHGLGGATLKRLSPTCALRQFTPTIVDHRASAQAAGKIGGWIVGMLNAIDGERVVFLDADTWVTKPLDAAFSEPFDVATTWHDRERWPLNSGVVFARASPLVRRWLGEWRHRTMKIIADREHHQEAIDIWGSADQAALGSEFEGLPNRALDARVYNEDWISERPEDVVIWHMKGALRAIREGRDDPRMAQPVYQEWRRAADL